MPKIPNVEQADWLETRRLVARALRVSLESVDEDASLNTMEALDSLGHLRIILEIAEAIGTELTGEQVSGIDGIRDIARILAPWSGSSGAP